MMNADVEYKVKQAPPEANISENDALDHQSSYITKSKTKAKSGDPDVFFTQNFKNTDKTVKAYTYKYWQNGSTRNYFSKPNWYRGQAITLHLNHTFEKLSESRRGKKVTITCSTS